ncbi:stage II sporulation protein P [Defluviitalea saccharophila]|uniref:Stage II sporulation protein P n=1 Tax=Defluviitalea saccharophila TaxID=879970 RepID=A0ABZ2Y592_9FIRM
MVRIHTISLGRVKSKIYAILIIIFTVLILSKFIVPSSRSAKNNLENDVPIFTQQLEEHQLDSELYKKVLVETIPYVDGHSKDGHTVDNFFIDIFAFITDIHWNNLTTVLEEVIPLARYMNNNVVQYTQNVIEVDGVFNEYTGNKEVIQQNDEDYYQIEAEDEDTFEDPFASSQIRYTKTQLRSIDFLQRNLYNFEGDLKLTYADIPAVDLINRDISLKKQSNKPQILIFHTHSQEHFADSDPNQLDDGVIGLGETLAKILHEEYGIGVLHNKGQYDVVQGKLMRDGSYERMEPAIRKILQQNPSIEVIIDLHRDGIEKGKLVTKVNGKPTAKIMLVNGICKTMKNGKLTDLTSLPNPYLKDNLAFSLQMQLKANELYPGLMRKIYIKPYRYSLHMLPKSLLVEVGANTNTVEEARNAMAPLAKILCEVLKVK